MLILLCSSSYFLMRMSERMTHSTKFAHFHLIACARYKSIRCLTVYIYSNSISFGMMKTHSIYSLRLFVRSVVHSFPNACNSECKKKKSRAEQTGQWKFTTNKQIKIRIENLFIFSDREPISVWIARMISMLDTGSFHTIRCIFGTVVFSACVFTRKQTSHHIIITKWCSEWENCSLTRLHVLITWFAYVVSVYVFFFWDSNYQQWKWPLDW